jgi:hypothetical protein
MVNAMHRTLPFLLFLVWIGCLFSMPNWYRTPMNFYNRNEYIAGIGEGASYDEATNHAKASLISQISVSVEYHAKTRRDELLTERGGFYEIQTISAIQARSEHQLVGWQYLFQEEMNGVFYVMVGVNIARMLNRVESESEEVTNRVSGMIRNAEDHISRNDIVTALDSYHEAIKELNTLIQNKVFFDAFSNRVFHIREDISYSRLRNRTMALINSINFEIINEEREPTIRGRRLSNPVVFRAYFIDPNRRRVNIGGLPVSIMFSDRREIEVGVTNRNGEYRISAITEYFNTSREKIMIQINPKSYPHFEERFLNNNTAEIIVSQIPMQVRLHVVDTSGNTHQVVQTRLSIHLSHLRIEQSHDAPIILEAIVHWGSARFGSFVETNVHVDINVKIFDTGQVLGSTQLNGMGTSTDEADSLNAAIRNMNLRRLTNLMNRVRND